MNELTQHVLATIAYRFKRSTMYAGFDYANFNPGKEVKPPVEILNHMNNVLEYMRAVLEEDKRVSVELSGWEIEVQSFGDILLKLDDLISSNNYSATLLKKMMQGPLSDVLTHIGQLAMLSRLCGKPIKGENFTKAKIISVEQVWADN